MDEAAVEDEKKPFDAEDKQNDNDAQPDPDEPLIMDAGNGRVWLVKVRDTSFGRRACVHVLLTLDS